MTLSPSSSHGLAAADTAQIATVTLTAAQVLALFTTPVVIVPGVAGQAHVPVGNVTLEYEAVTTPYVDHGGNIQLDYPTVGPFVSLATAGFWTGAAGIIFFKAASTTGSNTPANVAGKDLRILQSVANPTAGDGLVIVSFAYITIAVA